ncbi:MAG: dethiobiotin synthase [Proteobacteria bacterium]|nr:dethiobiotin synthase [Pseudomonadota bacterium]
MRYFVTGTDTGIGKTYTLTLMLKFFIHKGLDVFAIKPIETGCLEESGRLIPEDGIKIASAINGLDNLDEICPVRFKTPQSPYSADKIEKRGIDLDKIKKIISKRSSPVFIEGAGGLLVPVFKNYFMIDMAKELADEILLVSSLRLGTINHTLLSIEAIKKRGLKIAGIILNDNDGKEEISKKTNFEVLKELTEERLLGVIPFNFNDYKNLDKIIQLDFMVSSK